LIISSRIVPGNTIEKQGQRRDNHRQRLLERTGCKSTVGLVKFPIKNGLE